MYYQLTVGPFHKKISEDLFFTTFNDENYNLDKIKDILTKDKIDINNIDEYYYYDNDKNGYVIIQSLKEYKKPSKGKFLLELHCKRNNPILSKLDDYNVNLKFKYKKALNKIEKINKLRNEEKYDLIFLYASPIKEDKESEAFISINYRLEMKKIQKVMIKSKKEFNCLFECANERIFRNTLKKPTKILYISSHGFYDYNDEYSLILEEKGFRQEIAKNDLEDIIKANAEKLKYIDLVFVSTCYGQHLGKIFSDNGVKNVICIHGLTQISMLSSIKFTEYFFEELIKTDNIKISFKKAKERIKSNSIIIMKNRTCKNHVHKKNCDLQKYERFRLLSNNFCDCDYGEFNIHLRDCPYIVYLRKNEKLNKIITYKEYKEKYLKICCCGYDNILEKYDLLKDEDNYYKKRNKSTNFENELDNDLYDDNENDIPHCEVGKFFLLSKEKNNDIKAEIYKNNKKGKLITNNNIIIQDSYTLKDFSIVGRREEISQIYNI